MVAALIVLSVAGLVALWLLAERRRFLGLKHYLDTSRSQAEAQLSRRHELVRNLGDLLEGPLAHQRETLAALLSAHRAATAALEAGPASADSIDAEAQLGALLRSVIAFVRETPGLEAHSDLRALQDELRSSENRIAFARQLYRDSVCFYNAGCARFPARLLTRGAGQIELWKLPEPTDQAQPAGLAA